MCRVLIPAFDHDFISIEIKKRKRQIATQYRTLLPAEAQHYFGVFTSERCFKVIYAILPFLLILKFVIQNEFHFPIYRKIIKFRKTSFFNRISNNNQTRKPHSYQLINLLCAGENSLSKIFKMCIQIGKIILRFFGTNFRFLHTISGLQ